MPTLPILAGEDFSHDPSALAVALRDRGVCWIAGWPDLAFCAALRDDLQRLRSDGALSQAAIGRGGGHALRRDIRADTTCWLDDPRCGEAAGVFLARFDAIRVALNRALYLGLDGFEAHYAAYPPGGGYARHRDRFRDSDARVVSWVTYLNPGWGTDDGGALRLYPPHPSPENGSDGEAVIELSPTGGSVCFLSELEHEVLPARRERFSIAGWMRRHVREPSARMPPNARSVDA